MEAAEGKKRVRKDIEAVRASLGDDELLRRSPAVTARLLALPEYARARSVMIYVSKRNEVDTHELIRRSVEDGKIVAAPVAIPATRNLALGPVRDFDSDLEPGRYDVLEPRRTGVDPLSIDVFVVPGIAFDLAGNRLGSGWGYFDNLLSRFRRGQITVGLAFDFQMVKRLDSEDHDIAVDVILSETRTIRVRHKRRKQ